MFRQLDYFNLILRHFMSRPGQLKSVARFFIGAYIFCNVACCIFYFKFIFTKYKNDRNRVELCQKKHF